MYFGRNIGDTGDRVQNYEFADFTQTHIMPVFSGFTLYNAIGYWKGKSEDYFIIEVITDSKSVALKMIKRICKAYKHQFEQESVLVTRQPVDREFV